MTKHNQSQTKNQRNKKVQTFNMDEIIDRTQNMEKNKKTSKINHIKYFKKNQSSIFSKLTDSLTSYSEIEAINRYLFLIAKILTEQAENLEPNKRLNNLDMAKNCYNKIASTIREIPPFSLTNLLPQQLLEADYFLIKIDFEKAKAIADDPNASLESIQKALTNIKNFQTTLNASYDDETNKQLLGITPRFLDKINIIKKELHQNATKLSHPAVTAPGTKTQEAVTTTNSSTKRHKRTTAERSAKLPAAKKPKTALSTIDNAPQEETLATTSQDMVETAINAIDYQIFSPSTDHSEKKKEVEQHAVVNLETAQVLQQTEETPWSPDFTEHLEEANTLRQTQLPRRPWLNFFGNHSPGTAFEQNVNAFTLALTILFSRTSQCVHLTNMLLASAEYFTQNDLTKINHKTTIHQMILKLDPDNLIARQRLKNITISQAIPEDQRLDQFINMMKTICTDMLEKTSDTMDNFVRFLETEIRKHNILGRQSETQAKLLATNYSNCNLAEFNPSFDLN